MTSRCCFIPNPTSTHADDDDDDDTHKFVGVGRDSFVDARPAFMELLLLLLTYM